MKRVAWLLLIACRAADAECWSVGPMAGYSTMQGDEYAILPDRIATFTDVLLSGDDSKVTGTERMQCRQTGLLEVACTAVPALGSYVSETWIIDPAAHVAIMSRTREGMGPLNGAALFKGTILGKCGNAAPL